MSFRPRFPVGNNPYPTPPRSRNNNNNNIPLMNVNFPHKSNDGYRPNIRSNFPNFRNISPPNMNPNPLVNSNTFAPKMHDSSNSNNFHNNMYTSSQQSNSTVPFSSSGSVSSCASNLLNSDPHFSNVNPPLNHYNKQPVGQNSNLGVSFNSNSNNTYCNRYQLNSSNQQFSHPQQNIAFNHPPPIINFQNNQNNVGTNTSGMNMPNTLPRPPQISVTANENMGNMIPGVNNAIQTFKNVNNYVPQPTNYVNSLMVPPVLNMPQVPVPLSNLQKNYAPSPMLMNIPQVPSTNLQNDYVSSQIFKSDASSSCFVNNVSIPLICEKERKLCEFLAKCSITKKKKENQITVPEFRYAVKATVHMIKLLCERKMKLTNILHADENEWKDEMESIFNLKNELSAMCSFISAPDYLSILKKKLELIKKRRSRKKKTKENKFSEKVKAKQNREALSQDIDKWLDDIKEQNMKLKREVDMKKEADFILLEVRRKIHEAKRTIEKIKVFEKLRTARQFNAVRKGLHILSFHNEKFEKKMSILKETMLKQLVDYEAEEKALKVMLETEQEGQLEEEAQWKIKKATSLQQKRQNHINECLFGISDDPLPTDPLYLFHKYHTTANNSIENLIQIRHQWDTNLCEDGESIPRQWIVPVAANNASWEQYLTPKS